MTTLGQLRRLPPQHVWPEEARDFTPWLAENIENLGEAIGMELELSGREVAVGAFSADLVATDLGSGDPVVIENQYGKTDHDHLGKIITYASGLDARVVIWLCESLREEHRQALEWLNKRTDEDTLFFAVQIEILQIDRSSPALNFKTLVAPNEWQKQAKKTSKDELSPRARAYREFFQRLIDSLREGYGFTNARVAQPQSWYEFASGYSGIRYAASFALGRRVRVETYIDVGDKDANAEIFDFLHARSERIEIGMGQRLEWEPLETKRACRVALYRPGTIELEESELAEIREWITQNVRAMKRVFGPVLAEHFGR